LPIPEKIAILNFHGECFGLMKWHIPYTAVKGLIKWHLTKWWLMKCQADEKHGTQNYATYFSRKT